MDTGLRRHDDVIAFKLFHPNPRHPGPRAGIHRNAILETIVAPMVMGKGCSGQPYCISTRACPASIASVLGIHGGHTGLRRHDDAIVFNRFHPNPRHPGPRAFVIPDPDPGSIVMRYLKQSWPRW